MGNPRIIIEGDAASLEKALDAAGKKLGQFQEQLPTKSIGFAKEAAVALGLTLGGGSFIAAISSAIAALDHLDEAAQSAGVSSVEALQGLRYGASFAGVEADILQKALEQLASKLVDAGAGGKEAAEVFDRMGLRIKNSSGQLATTDEALAKIADKFASYRDGAEKTALAADLFGQKIGPKLVPFLNQGADGIERLKAEAEKMGLIIGGPAVKAAADLSDQMDRLRAQTEGAWTALATKLVPEISKAIEEFEAARRAGGGFISSLILLATQSAETLRDPAEKIAKIRDDIAKLEAELKRTGVGDIAAQRDIAFTLSGLEKELTFLKEIQRNRALANAPSGITDQVSRSQRGETAPGKTPAEDPRANQEADRLKKLIEKNLELSEIEKVRTKIVEGGYGKISVKVQEYLQLLAQEADVTELGRRAQQEAEKARDEEEKRNEEADAGLTAYMQSYYSSVSERLSLLRDELKDEATIENERISQRLQLLQEARDLDKLSQEEYFTLSQAAAADHEARITEIQDAELRKRYGIQQVYRKLDLDSAQFALKSIAQLMNTNNRQQFEIGKAAAIGNAVIDTYRAATGAYAALSSIPYVGPYLGAAAAAAAIAAGIANVEKIRSTPFGGGAVAATAPALPSSTAGASPDSQTSALPVQPTFAPVPRTVDITLVGQTYTAEQVRDLIEQFNEQTEFGAVITVNRG